MIIRDTVHIRQEIGEITSSRPWKYNGHSQGPGCVPLQSTVYYPGIAMQWLSRTCGAVSGTVYQCEALICPCFVVMKRISKCHDATMPRCHAVNASRSIVSRVRQCLTGAMAQCDRWCYMGHRAMPRVLSAAMAGMHIGEHSLAAATE